MLCVQPAATPALALTIAIARPGTDQNLLRLGGWLLARCATVLAWAALQYMLATIALRPWPSTHPAPPNLILLLPNWPPVQVLLHKVCKPC